MTSTKAPKLAGTSRRRSATSSLRETSTNAP